MRIPLNKPSRIPKAIAKGITIAMLARCASHADAQATSASPDATDRSMLPVMMTKVMASASRPISMSSDVESSR